MGREGCRTCQGVAREEGMWLVRLAGCRWRLRMCGWEGVCVEAEYVAGRDVGENGEGGREGLRTPVV